MVTFNSICTANNLFASHIRTLFKTMGSLLEIIMTPEQQVSEINLAQSNANTAKYLSGQKEHGGDFFAKPTVENIHQEVTDLVNYIYVLRKHREECLALVKECFAISTDADLDFTLAKLQTKLKNL